MNRVTRKLLALVSIAGGGLLGAAPVAAAAPSDPTPPTVPAATSDAQPNPAPLPDPAVRTGRAPAPGDAGGATGATPARPVDGPVEPRHAVDRSVVACSCAVEPGVTTPIPSHHPPSRHERRQRVGREATDGQHRHRPASAGSPRARHRHR